MNGVGQIKQCYTCQEVKPVSEYHKHPQKKDLLNPNCKVCVSLKSKKDYKKRRNKIRAKSKEYYENNKKEIIKKQNEYNIKKRKTDPNFKVIRNLRNRLYYAIKNTEWKKDTHFSEYIGCDRDKLISHIESLFQEGMNWDNYGKWHIDHIIPLSSAKTKKHLYDLCHYSNLQPLWAKDNIKKHNKINGAKVSDYIVQQIDPKDCEHFILNIHYAKRKPPIQYAFGLIKNNELVGICTFAKPTGRHVAKYITENTDSVLELNRLVLSDNIKNEASILVSRAIKLLPNNSIIVSFSDTDQNHQGYVYQACNFKYFGTTLPRKEMQSEYNIHSSTLAKNPEKYKAKLGDRSIKHRYIYCKDYSLIKLNELPYPK